MFTVATGHSEGIETLRTTRMVIAQCKDQLEGLMPRSGIVYSSYRSDYQSMLQEIVKEFPGIALAGCSSGGEMSAINGFCEDSICLILFASDTINMASSMAEKVSDNPVEVIENAIDQAVKTFEGAPKLCIVHGNNLHACPVCIIDAIHEKLGKECQVFGGYAAAELSSESEVFQFCDTQVEKDSVSLLLFSGPIETGFCVSNSWTPMGSRALVDKVKDNYITQIGGKPAMQFFQDVFGPHSEPVIEMPLAVFDDEGHYYIRVANQFDKTNLSVRFDSVIPEGSIVQFTEATPEGILSDTRESVAELIDSNSWIPRAALVVSCMARKTILGLKSDQESLAIKENLPENTPFVGFYSYGEIAPFADESSPVYHHCTMAMLLIGEKENNSPLKPLLEIRTEQSDQDMDLNIKLLQRKLERAHQSQARLEYTKAMASRMQKKMNEDLALAKQKIEEQHSILKESLTLAQQVQQRLLPQIQPQFPGFEIAGKSIYCDETGGDYFDYLVLPEAEGNLSVVVGDVAGHGIASALLMATARALLRMRASKEGSPAEVISDLNRFLSTDIQGSGQFMSLFYLVLEPMENRMTWVRAGHDPALRYVPSKDVFVEMQGEGLVLGVMDDWKYNQYQTQMAEPGEIILIGTDGIWETRDEKKRFFGKERFMAVIRKNADKPAEEIVQACLDSVAEFRMTLPVHDDITLVVIKAVG